MSGSDYDGKDQAYRDLLDENKGNITISKKTIEELNSLADGLGGITDRIENIAWRLKEQAKEKE